MASGLLAEPSIPPIFWFLMRSMIQYASYGNEFTSTLNRALLLMWQSTWHSDLLDCSTPSVVALDWELVIKFVLFRPRNCTKSYKAQGGPQHAYDTYPRLYLSMSPPCGAHICTSRKGVLSRDMQRDPPSLGGPSILVGATAWSSDPREPAWAADRDVEFSDNKERLGYCWQGTTNLRFSSTLPLASGVTECCSLGTLGQGSRHVKRRVQIVWEATTLNRQLEGASLVIGFSSR